MEVDGWVFALVVLLNVVVGDEYFLALVALVQGAVILCRKFEEVLICAERFCLQRKVSLELGALTSLSPGFVLGSCFFFIDVLVVCVERLGQRLEVVLGIDQVLNRHLGHPEQLHDISIADFFDVLTVELSISQVL